MYTQFWQRFTGLENILHKSFVVAIMKFKNVAIRKMCIGVS